MIRQIRTLVIISLSVFLASCCPTPEPEPKQPPKRPKAVALTDLSSLYQSHNKTELPKFVCIQDVKTKKELFFGFILQLVREHDEQILTTREAIITLQENYLLAQTQQATEKQSDQETKEALITDDQTQWLKKLAKIHRVKLAIEHPDFFNQLLLSVDVIPASMAMAQAANESAWGTSRFATYANNLFGQWCFKSGCGLIPQQRPEGATYEVKVFSTPSEAVGQYMLNINRNKSYQQVRDVRKKYRAKEAVISGYSVVEGLENYSARGHAYIEELRSMIRFNKLSQWDNPKATYSEISKIAVPNCS